MRFVPIKSEPQQSGPMVHRTRHPTNAADTPELAPRRDSPRDVSARPGYSLKKS
jgi:hypothetical protein